MRPRSRERPTRWRSSPGLLPADTPLAKRSNSLFMGTHVVSGSATAVVVHTAKDTEFGQVSERLRLRAAETEFEHGVRRFGYFLMEVTMVLVDRHLCHKRHSAPSGARLVPFLDGSRGGTHAAAPPGDHQHQPGARRQAHGGRRRSSSSAWPPSRISGSMNVLCSDKTGTLTEGEVRLHAALDVNGTESDRGPALRVP